MALLCYSQLWKFIFMQYQYIHCSTSLYVHTPSLKKYNFCHKQIYLSLAGKGLNPLMPILPFLPTLYKLWKNSNAWHSQVHWLFGTAYLAIKASNVVGRFNLASYGFNLKWKFSSLNIFSLLHMKSSIIFFKINLLANIAYASSELHVYQNEKCVPN